VHEVDLRPTNSSVTNTISQKSNEKSEQIGERRLSASLPKRVHPVSINLIFYERPNVSFRGGFHT
jgi:ATP-dependent protease HslVU (ClpYQ) ATPase subunit